MMRVVFNDLRRETFTSVGGVIQIDAQCSKINGRYTNVWILKLSNEEFLAAFKNDEEEETPTF